MIKPLSRLAKMALGERPEDAWQPADARYSSLFALEAHAKSLTGRGGIFVVWHLGVRPQWLKVGASLDLAQSLGAAASCSAVAAFRPNGGVFAAWVFLPPDRAPGVVVALSARLRPRLQAVSLQGETAPTTIEALPFPLPPGTFGS